MRELIKSLEEVMAVSIGNPDARKMAAYDLARKTRDFAGELAFKLADKNEPEGEMAHNFPKVKSAGNRAVTALEQFSKSVYDTEKYIDVGAPVRGRIGEQARSWEDMVQDGNRCANDIWEAYLNFKEAEDNLAVAAQSMKEIVGFYTGEGKAFKDDMRELSNMKTSTKKSAQDLFLMVNKIREFLNKGE